MRENRNLKAKIHRFSLCKGYHVCELLSPLFSNGYFDARVECSWSVEKSTKMLNPVESIKNTQSTPSLTF